MILDVWQSWRSQVHPNMEDIEENVGAANKVPLKKEKKMCLIWIKMCQQEKIKWMKCWYCLEGENPEDHKFIRTKVLVAETWNEVNKMGKKMINWWNMYYNNVSFLEGSMVKKQRENTKENGITSPPCHTCQMYNYHTGGHSNYLMVSAVKTAAKKKTQQEDGTT